MKVVSDTLSRQRLCIVSQFFMYANGDYLYQNASCKAMGSAPEYLEW
ncbi:hypothetical protein [Dysgonomonas termitidis]|uniref:Uncharacterized protein n=1 Tax=Dysgonomonas termitidis TaxID=1516126 RepID=A0ABV9KYL2_9BACT